jgi:hypothetical protein
MKKVLAIAALSLVGCSIFAGNIQLISGDPANELLAMTNDDQEVHFSMSRPGRISVYENNYQFGLRWVAMMGKGQEIKTIDLSHDSNCATVVNMKDLYDTKVRVIVTGDFDPNTGVDNRTATCEIFHS